MSASDETIRRRIAALRLALLRTHDKKQGGKQKAPCLDGLIVSNITNIGYITGFTGSTALVLLMPDTAHIIVDSRYVNQARQECPRYTVDTTVSSAGIVDALVQVTARYNKLRLGFEASDVTVAKLASWKSKLPADIRLKPSRGMVEKLRAIKDDDEIAAIKSSIRLAEAAFKKVAKLLVHGTVESRFAAELEIAMRRAGAQKAAFDTIVASGPNGARPHHGSSDRAFEAGDMVTIDWGAVLNGYCSDLTRTVLIGGGQLSAKQLDVYSTVLEAKNRATAAIKPGKTGKEIDDIARDYIASRGYGDHFGHSLGHALGLEVHDGPSLSQHAENVVLEAGMVTTVEPGIYIDGWGGVRIEDDVLVTSNGCELLSVEAK